jgi:prophage maintenance system killer protein
MTKDTIDQTQIAKLLPFLVQLEEYDKGVISLKDKVAEITRLDFQECLHAIIATKKQLEISGQATQFFGVDNNNNLQSIINNLYASYDGVEIYPSFEDKAANLLYLVIKDHPFVDGNKRIGLVLFSIYCYTNNRDIQVIPSLALQIAQSKPEERQLVLDLIISLLQTDIC